MHRSSNHLPVKSLVACALFFVGCGASHDHPHPHGEDAPHSDVLMPCVAPGTPNAECGFVVNGCCYATAAQACHVAGCAEDNCTILESFPAQVSCR